MRNNNTLSRVFDAFNGKKASYIVRTSYEKLPYSLNGKDVDLLVAREDFLIVREILKKEGFIFYPFTEPHYLYYFYDSKLGLIEIDILLASKIPKRKKYRNFYILKEEKKYNYNKSFPYKLKTGIKRKLHFLFKGKLVCFIGPDGSGKTTSMNAVFDSLKNFPVRKERMLFGALKPSPIQRALSRIGSIIKVYMNIFSGKLTLTDRYLYLTFRKSHPIFRKIFRAIAPKPNIVFVMKASYSLLKKRRKDDVLDEKTVNDLYRLFEKIKNAEWIDTSKNYKKNIDFMIKRVLDLYRR